MVNSPLRLLVLGCGSIGRRHLQNLRTLGIKELFAYDPLPDRLNGVVRELGVVPCCSIAEGFDRLPHGVLICTPPALHVELARPSLQRGAHVFIEKPISHTLEGVADLCAMARRSARVIQVGYQLRFHPGLRCLKAWVDEGRVGRVLFIQAEFGQYLPDWRPAQHYEESYTAHAALGGGMLLDASHEIDYVRWLAGEVETVTAVTAHMSDLKMDAEDLALLWLSLSNGRRASLHLDCAQRASVRTCKIVGAEGTLIWDYLEGLRWYRADTRCWETIPIPLDPNVLYLEELKEFLSCLKGEALPVVSGEEALRVLEVVVAAHASARLGREVACASAAPSEVCR